MTSFIIIANIVKKYDKKNRLTQNQNGYKIDNSSLNINKDYKKPEYFSDILRRAVNFC